MRFPTLAALALAASGATLASAQNPAARAGTAVQPAQAQSAQTAPVANGGFFRPAPDPNLTGPRPGDRATRPTEALVAEDRVQAGTERNNDRAPDPAKVVQWSERQMDRSAEEAERAKPAPGTPAPINGAFTGSTNERDR